MSSKKNVTRKKIPKKIIKGGSNLANANELNHELTNLTMDMILVGVSAFAVTIRLFGEPFYDYVVKNSGGRDLKDTNYVRNVFLAMARFLDHEEVAVQLRNASSAYEELVKKFIVLLGEPLRAALETMTPLIASSAATVGWGVFDGVVDSNPLSGEAWNLFSTVAILGMKISSGIMQATGLMLDSQDEIFEWFSYLQKFVLMHQKSGLFPISPPGISGGGNKKPKQTKHRIVHSINNFTRRK